MITTATWSRVVIDAAALPFSRLKPSSQEARALADHFHDLQQQRAAHILGLWIFLVTEALFFGAMFATYFIYRLVYPEAFAAAAKETEILYGTINTVLLLTSGLCAALAKKAGDLDMRRGALLFCGATIALGCLFLTTKAYEYYLDLAHHFWPAAAEFALTDPPARIFWSLYWLMTGVHALHMSVGIVLWIVLFEMIRRRSFPMRTASRIKIISLYWAFVDLMWLIIWPLLYLVGRT